VVVPYKGAGSSYSVSSHLALSSISWSTSTTLASDSDLKLCWGSALHGSRGQLSDLFIYSRKLSVRCVEDYAGVSPRSAGSSALSRS
jgi:hypothetical protein